MSGVSNGGMAASRDVDPETLLRHRDFVRAVVRRLLPDECLVDEVVQETFLAALRRPPRVRAALRAWLARVGRNLALSRLRSERRRAVHERRAARQESVPSPAEMADKLATHRQVVDAVLSLREPLRSTVLLRFFEDLPPRREAAATRPPGRSAIVRAARTVCGGRAT